MCATCGCDGEVHVHGHGHDHAHESETRTLKLEADLLAKNDRLAAENRAWLDAHRIMALNLMGSPGAGKTALLEAVLRALVERVPVAVLEGDQETDRDAERIRAAGAPVVQINTGAGCHLDAHMVHHGLEDLAPAGGSILFIENVGNLVCPALFDLGEHQKVVVMSVTEGDDKPLKYPHMFRGADVLVLNKIDLLEHVDFDVDRALGHARALAPDLRVFMVSARRGDGIDALCDWLTSHASGEEKSELHGEAQRIEELLEELSSMVGPLAWQRIEELMHATVSVYGAGLARTLDHARAAGAAGKALEKRLCADELVSSLMRLHGLHPVPPEERARTALMRAADALARQGIEVKHTELAGTDLLVRVATTTAPSASYSPSNALALIERTVNEAAPELSHVKVEGLPEAPARLVQIALGPSRGAAR